jgi:hypothetical protein
MTAFGGVAVDLDGLGTENAPKQIPIHLSESGRLVRPPDEPTPAGFMKGQDSR